MNATVTSFLSEHFKKVLLVIFVGATFYAVLGGIQIYNDSEGYLNMSIIRLPVYALLTQVFYQEDLPAILVIFQITSVCISIYLLVNNFRKNLDLSPGWLLLLACILLYPCVFGEKIANAVLSEAIAYSLYLLVFHFFSLALFTEKTKYVLWSLPILFLLLLTRGQFVFLVPIAVALLLWISFKKKIWSRNLALMVLLVALPFLVSLTDKTYHLAANGHFVSTPWTGLHLLTPVLFVSQAEDVTIFKDEEERQFFNAIFAKLWERKLNIHHPDLAGVDKTYLYREKFTRIANWTINDYGKETLDNSLSADEKYIEIERLTMKMAPPLIIKNFKAWFILNFKNFLAGFGSLTISSFYFILLVFCGVLLARRRHGNNLRILFFGAALTIANIATVAVGMHTIKRFTFYNDWVFFLTVFLLLIALQKSTRNAQIQRQ
ncbi:MAG: hypothetical protein WBA61_03880 [Aequorivita sp.]